MEYKQFFKEIKKLNEGRGNTILSFMLGFFESELYGIINNAFKKNRSVSDFKIQNIQK